MKGNSGNLICAIKYMYYEHVINIIIVAILLWTFAFDSKAHESGHLQLYRRPVL